MSRISMTRSTWTTCLNLGGGIIERNNLLLCHFDKNVKKKGTRCSFCTFSPALLVRLEEPRREGSDVETIQWEILYQCAYLDMVPGHLSIGSR